MTSRVRPSAVSALLLLTFDHVRRLLREGIVLRSLVFPGALVAATVLGVVAFVTWNQPPQRAALSPEAATDGLVAAIRTDGFEVLVVDDPRAAVRDEAAAVGTDGTTLYVGPNQVQPTLEAHLRRSLGASWEPFQPRTMRAKAIQGDDSPRRLAVFIGALFALYGVVFGAGGIARDRDEGTLDAELSTGVPHVVHGLARWLAGSLVLGGFFTLTVWMFDALMGIADVASLSLHGAAATATATSIGLLVIGRSGLDRGFAGPMSGGLVGVFGLVSVGLARRDVGHLLPIASLVTTDASPWPPVSLAVTSGLIAAVVFARRTAVS